MNDILEDININRIIEDPPGPILFISTPSTWRGGEQQLAYLLEELDKHRWEFSVLCPLGSALHNFCKKRNLNVFSFPRKGPANIFLGKRIKQLCSKNSFAVLHANDSHAHTGAVIASLLGDDTPIVLHRRVDFPVKNNIFSKRKYNWPSIKAIICISKKVKDVISPAIKNKELLKVVYSSVDLDRFKVHKRALNLRDKYNLPEEAVTVGMVAAFAPHKDYGTFVQTASKIISKNNKVYFFAVGEGAYRQEIEKMISDKGLENHVILTGFQDDIPGLLSQLDIFLLSSSAEGLGTSILDAFASGVPVVATKAGGIPEIVIDEKTGLLAPVNDADKLAKNVLRILNESGLSKKLTNGAREIMTGFYKENMALHIMGILKNVVR